MTKTIERREFLFGMAAGGVTLLSGCVSPENAGRGENVVVFVSDPHVCGNPRNVRYQYTRKWLRDTVRDILRIRPRCVVSFGDLCFDHGEAWDYRVAREILKPLADAGIPVFHATGNHDRRDTFRAHFPEAFAASPVPGALVTVADLGVCDLLLLDSLKGKDGESSGPVEGALSQAQQDWLLSELPRRGRPFLVGAHHPPKELSVGGRKLIDVLGAYPLFAGYVHGHNHMWVPQWQTAWACQRRTVSVLTLPSSGLWGDIGYVVCRFTPTEMRAELVMKDFWNPVPGRPERDRVEKILRERRGRSMDFILPRA